MEIFSIEFFIGLALIGIVAGFASGLLGIGGGFLIVPLQYFLLQSVGVNPELAMLVSLGTSLAIIIPTGLSGAYTHSKSMDGIIKPGFQLGIFGIIGGIIGGIIASMLSVSVLESIFGVVLLFIGVYNILTQNKTENKSLIPFNIISMIIIGMGVGILSGLLGIGGGIFLTLFLTALLGFSMVEAIGISSMYISLTAIGGTLSYIATGWGLNTMPYSLGYVSLIDFIVIVIFSVPLANIGAKLSHKLPEKRLKQIFSIVLFYIGFKMLGILP